MFLLALKQGVGPVERTYDLFEKHEDGTMIWKATIDGHEPAIAKLRELAGKTKNEIQVLHLPTKSLVATMNATDTTNALNV
jgi:hypothetical protein